MEDAERKFHDMEYHFTWFDDTRRLIHEPIYVPVTQEAKVLPLMDQSVQDLEPLSLPKEILVRIEDRQGSRRNRTHSLSYRSVYNELTLRSISLKRQGLMLWRRS
eukprot:5842146-Prorocentrum_lima.AAC.1